MASVRTPIIHGKARFTAYGEGCIRIEFSESGEFSPFPSLVMGKGRIPKAMDVDVTRRGKRLTLKTPSLTLTHRDDGEMFSPANLQIEHRNAWDKKETWVPGKRDSGNLGTVRRCLDQWSWCGGPDHCPVEGILSTDGGHLLEDRARIYWNSKYDWPQDLSARVQFDGVFFAYGNNYKRALQDFVRVFGRVPLVPRWTFGFWYSRWYAYSDKEILALTRRYHREKIPLDVMIIDTDWRDGWGGYDWSKKYFPNPEKTLQALKEMGVRSSLNDHPGYGNYDALPDGDSHIPAIEKKLGPLPHQGQWACDWSRKDHVEVWRKDLLGPFFDQGMDFWWIDGWIKSPFGECDSQLWANQQYFELAEEKTGKRGLILSRWGGIGSHRYPVQFSGDTASEWGVLQHQIEYTARSCGLGAVYWSHDIGGFFGKKVDEELYIRWFQFGSLSPVFRTHSDHGLREPWKFSKRVVSLFRKQTRMRYALAPYFYTLAREAYDTGLPIIRPLYLEYNVVDGGALNHKHQYTIGRDLLVIPGDAPADKRTGRQRKRAYFPPGVWYGVETGEIVQGTLNCMIEIPVDRIPVYVRRGAIIPSQEVSNTLGTRPPQAIAFDCFPDPGVATTYTLYEDDGESKAYEDKQFARTRISMKKTSDRVEVTIAAPKGSYRGMHKRRKYIVRMYLDKSEEVERVTAKTGKSACRDVTHSEVSRCLAGTVQSGLRFCEISIEAGRVPVRLCLYIK